MNFKEEYQSFFSANTTNWAFYVFIYTNTFYSIFSLSINCYILWLMLTGKGTGFVTDFFTFNLSLGEIFYCCGSLISFAISSFSLYPKFISFVGVIPIFGRPLFLCLICVERYVAVVHPVTFLKYKPLRYRLTCSAVVWVKVFGFGLFCMFILSANNMYIYICVALPIYSIFLTIKLFSCLAVVRALKVPGPGERGRQREKANLMKRKAIIHILILTVSMVINYTPIYLVGIFYGILQENDFLVFLRCGVSISIVVAFVQPFLYIKQFGNLTQVFRSMVKSLNCF